MLTCIDESLQPSTLSFVKRLNILLLLDPIASFTRSATFAPTQIEPKWVCSSESGVSPLWFGTFKLAFA